jgi:hypothetical protein
MCAIELCRRSEMGAGPACGEAHGHVQDSFVGRLGGWATAQDVVGFRLHCSLIGLASLEGHPRFG